MTVSNILVTTVCILVSVSIIIVVNQNKQIQNIQKDIQKLKDNKISGWGNTDTITLAHISSKTEKE